MIDMEKVSVFATPASDIAAAFAHVLGPSSLAKELYDVLLRGYTLAHQTGSIVGNLPSTTRAT